VVVVEAAAVARGAPAGRRLKQRRQIRCDHDRRSVVAGLRERHRGGIGHRLRTVGIDDPFGDDVTAILRMGRDTGKQHADHDSKHCHSLMQSIAVQINFPFIHFVLPGDGGMATPPSLALLVHGVTPSPGVCAAPRGRFRFAPMRTARSVRTRNAGVSRDPAHPATTGFPADRAARCRKPDAWPVISEFRAIGVGRPSVRRSR
jgi:hypothetical protein